MITRHIYSSAFFASQWVCSEEESLLGSRNWWEERYKPTKLWQLLSHSQVLWRDDSDKGDKVIQAHRWWFRSALWLFENKVKPVPASNATYNCTSQPAVASSLTELLCLFWRGYVACNRDKDVYTSFLHSCWKNHYWHTWRPMVSFCFPTWRLSPVIAVRSDHFAAGEIVVRCRRSMQILASMQLHVHVKKLSSRLLRCNLSSICS